MRARNKLNVKHVASLSKPGVYSDGGGLYLRIRPTGSRAWIYIYTFQGKRREMGLGSDLDVTLAKAREKAVAARAEVLDGFDPLLAKALAKSEVKAPDKPIITFGQFAIKWLESIEDSFKNPKHRQQWRNTLSTYGASLFPMAIEAVSTDDVVAVLQPIWLSKSDTASRLRGRIERVLDAAKVSGLRSGENPASWRGHLELLLPKRGRSQVRHHAALPFSEIASFMSALKKRDAVAARALEFTILTAARSGEARGMTWGEVDFEAKVWTIPGNRMKAGVTHQVPLPDSAIRILLALRPTTPNAAGFVFLAPRGGSLSDMALSQLLKRMGYGHITVHGFRSTFRDWAGETTQFPREEVEMALAHTIESATERAYRRGRALEKRRLLMDTWADFCL